MTILEEELKQMFAERYGHAVSDYGANAESYWPLAEDILVIVRAHEAEDDHREVLIHGLTNTLASERKQDSERRKEWANRLRELLMTPDWVTLTELIAEIDPIEKEGERAK